MSDTRFRYCLNTATIRAHKLPLPQAMEIAARAGYGAIEPWIDEIDAYIAAGGSLPDLGKRASDLGLGIAGAIGFFEWIVDDDAQRERAFAEARRNMEMLAAIGGTRLAAPPFGATDRTDLCLRRAAERYRNLLELGEEYGVTPLLEVWGFSKTLSKLGEGLFVAALADHPKACVLADVYHLYKGGSGFDSLKLVSGAALPVFHMNDYPAEPGPDTITDADRVYPGYGVAPLPAILDTLAANGFDGWLSLELFNPAYYAQAPEAVAKAGLKAMSGLGERREERG